MKKIYVLLILAFFGFGVTHAQYRELSKAGWTAFADTNQAGQPASNAIDGDPTTLWHSPWDGVAYPQPHWIMVKFPKETTIEAFSYLPRSGAGNGTIKTYGFWVSSDSITWDSIAGGTWGEPWDVKRVVTFDKSYTVKYMKLISWEERYGQGFTSCAEFGALVLGADFTADTTEIMRGETINFTDKSGNNPVAWKWTFEGGTPATSTDQNPTVKYETAGVFDVTLIAIDSKGVGDTVTFTDYISVNIPNIDRSGWLVKYVDSQQSGAPPENVFDGDPSTIWHTEWSPNSVPYPHTLVIDMGAKIQVEGFAYLPRPGGGNGTVKDYEFYVLTDTAMWTDPNTWGTPVASGTWSSPWAAEKKVFLNTPVTGRYLIFYTLSERNDNDWTSCAELNVMGTIFGSVFTADRRDIYATQKVNFSGGPDGKSVYHWLCPGGTPSEVANEQNPSIQYNAAGTYDVTLITTSAADGSKDTLVKTGYINVKARPTTRPLDKDGWSVIAWDSQEEPNDRLAKYVIDGDLNTFWHTAWSERQDPYPHWLIIDMGKNQDIAGFTYYPRPGGGNGTVDSCAWLVSLDGEIWDTVARGDRTGGWADPWVFTLDKNVTGRFVKFLALSEKGYPADPTHVWASCGEIDVTTPITGTYFQADPRRIESGEMVYYLDLSAGNPTAWEWAFDKGDPSASTEQSPSVKYVIPYKQLGSSFGASLTVNGETYTKENYVTVDYYDPKSNGGVYIDTMNIGKAFQYLSGNGGKYERHLEKEITVIQGEKYVVKLGTHVPWNNYWVGTGMFVDWDQSRHFDKETEEVHYQKDNAVPSGDREVLFYLNVPADAPTGLTRMRVYSGVWSQEDPYNGLGYGEVEDYTINVVEAPTAAPVAQFDADTNALCAGGSVRFEYTYDDASTLATAWTWVVTNGDDTIAVSDMATPTVEFDTPGTYDVKLVVENANGKDSITVNPYVTVYGATDIDAGADDKVCPGSEVVLDVTEVDSVVWNNGVVNGEPFYPTDSLVYVATGYNEHNCAATDTVIIAVWDAVDTTVVKYGEDTLVAQGDPDMYIFQWIHADDGTAIEGATDTIFVAEHGGNYAVVVTQVAGGQCSDTSGVWAISITGIEDNFGDEISIYPNPNNGDFTVNIGREHATISVYNTIGSLVYKKEDANPVEHLSLDTEGVYFVKIELKGVTETRRVVVH